ncbi:CAP domain-containing protein [Sporomusa sp.]|uniref:CAP domain-containing protein n=1 Tax=Sporomusa sp. TaxID=2078658 RepID=UPI002CCF3ACE|nr:CAP domain-containing protein [Sporomusa sp.]HWR45005.1 CAP domain-containing protein [Sporomusa sp.]
MMIKKWLTKMVFGFVIMSLVTTSFGGAWATAAYAAPAEEQSLQDGDNNAVIGTVVALGLLAILAGGKKGGSGAATPKSTDTSTTPVTPSTTTPSTTTPVTPATKTPATPSTTTPSTSNSGSTSGLTADEAKAFQLLNADRAANGLPALKANMSLVRLAENYGQDMINRKFFSHYNPEGQSPFDRMKQAGISYRYAGENLAINSNVTTAENAFMNSSGHRANILNSNYTEVGVGVRYDSAGSAYVVQEFISK